MKPAVIFAVVLLTGCAVTSITYEHTRADGSKIAASYWSGKNLKASLSSNGVFNVEADASTATDANTRLIKQATESMIQLGAAAAK